MQESSANNQTVWRTEHSLNDMTNISTTEYKGWKNNLLLRNDSLELIVSLDVGPRVLSIRSTADPESNIFKNYEEQMGKSGEPEWCIRGGHRIWVAPENPVRTYVPDNVPVRYEFTGANGVLLHTPPAKACPLAKELRVSLEETEPVVRVNHRIVNCGSEVVSVASWGLSVMAPGGRCYIPMPPLGEHPRDLLPNRTMILWPYTDLSDPRWNFSSSYITLDQKKEGSPTKLGLRHREGWVAYQHDHLVFIKTIPDQPDQEYPDLGCNFETFTNPDMLEIESLSPLKQIAPGESIEHEEKWGLWNDLKPEQDRDTIFGHICNHAKTLL